jgi:hypothetical protein
MTSKATKRKKRRLRTCNNSFPTKEIERKLLKFHYKMQRRVGKILEHYSFRMEKYIPELKKNNIDEKHLRYVEKINKKFLIPHRNDEIIKRCSYSYLGKIKNITPCGLKTQYKYYCYWCKFNHNKAVSTLEKVSDEEISSIIEQKVVKDGKSFYSWRD